MFVCIISPVEYTFAESIFEEIIFGGDFLFADHEKILVSHGIVTWPLYSLEYVLQFLTPDLQMMFDDCALANFHLSSLPHMFVVFCLFWVLASRLSRDTLSSLQNNSPGIVL